VLKIVTAVGVALFALHREHEKAGSPIYEAVKNANARKARCPLCAEKINVKAIKCKHCGSEIALTK
jgi:DNA-directed RNA polymerase subunit RPC12/RpoP